jgi:hypothetical protein
MDTFIGLDLGQLVDPTAAVIVRRSLAIDETGRPDRTLQGRPLYRFDIAAMKRYPLGTSYPAIIRHVVGQLERTEMGRRPKLVIDGTGVGVAVVDMFRRALKPYARTIECWDIVITGGRAVTKTTRWTWHVAKIQIAGAIREALDSERLKVPREVDPDGILRRELQDFKVEITAAGNETFNARQGAHDDLVLATALPIWLASQPVMEMVVDADESNPLLRPRELAAVTREIEEIEDAEREALAMERGVMTPKRLAEIEAIRRDPFDPRWH